MKRMIVLPLIFLLVFSSCDAPFSEQKRNAEEELEYILTEFSLRDGIVYSNIGNAEYPLTDEMLERMFFGANLADFCYVRSAAVYFSRRFNENEILVLELFDLSHQKAILKLLSRRAEKKENAVLFANGVYIYLVCTDKNEEIKAFLS